MDFTGGIRLVAEETRKKIDDMNNKLAKENHPFKLAIIDIEQTELLEKNARYMTSEQFHTLVKNIKRDGGLSSVPFCYKVKEKYRVLSGNHRVMAAKEAGIKNILVMYTDKKLSKQEQIAIQLSHNAIEGQDDPVILKELWNEIKDIDLKFYSGLDDKVLGELEKVSIDPLSEVSLDYRTLSFVFLPEEAERLEKAFEEALKVCKANDIYVSKTTEFDRLLDAIAKTNDSYNIRNVATSMMIILDIFEKHQTDLSKGWEERTGSKKETVPLASILGTDNIPISAAKSVKKAVQKMMDKGDIKKNNLWQAIEIWAEKYLEENG